MQNRTVQTRVFNVKREKRSSFVLSAFTLAEVLITLGIIGVVAALTIPTLIQRQQEAATVAALKKAYSALSQAYISAVQDNGTPDNWNLIDSGSDQGAINMSNILIPYLRITKNCQNNTGCFPDDKYNYLSKLGQDDPNDSSVAKVRMSDGTILSFVVRSATCDNQRGTTSALNHVCGILGVDVNGLKKPNQVGVDYFCFLITKYGIIPNGTQPETANTFADNCKDSSSANGFGCAAWVLYNQNMDYLHCNNLTWNGPLTCQ